MLNCINSKNREKRRAEIFFDERINVHEENQRKEGDKGLDLYYVVGKSLAAGMKTK